MVVALRQVKPAISRYSPVSFQMGFEIESVIKYDLS